jgi:hypothetical protein
LLSHTAWPQEDHAIASCAFGTPIASYRGHPRVFLVLFVKTHQSGRNAEVVFRPMVRSGREITSVLVTLRVTFSLSRSERSTRNAEVFFRPMPTARPSSRCLPCHRWRVPNLHYSSPDRSPKRKRGKHNNLPSLTLRATVMRYAPKPSGHE